jgi:hypothetical protein
MDALHLLHASLTDLALRARRGRALIRPHVCADQGPAGRQVKNGRQLRKRRDKLG